MYSVLVDSFANGYPTTENLINSQLLLLYYFKLKKHFWLLRQHLWMERANTNCTTYISDSWSKEWLRTRWEIFL